MAAVPGASARADVARGADQGEHAMYAMVSALPISGTIRVGAEAYIFKKDLLKSEALKAIVEYPIFDNELASENNRTAYVRGILIVTNDSRFPGEQLTSIFVRKSNKRIAVEDRTSWTSGDKQQGVQF